MHAFLQIRRLPQRQWPTEPWQGRFGAPPAKLHAVARLVLLACAALAPATLTWAQQASSNTPRQPSSKPLQLQASPWLQENLPDLPGNATSTVILADRMDGAIDQHVTATGNAELRRPGEVLKADVIRHDQTTNTMHARGKVRLNRRGDIFRGDTLDLQLDSYAGAFDNTEFEILRTGGMGKASKVDFVDSTYSIVHDGIYSTCYPDPDKPDEWNPDWYIRGRRVVLDKERDEGFVENGALVFGGVPIIPVPRFGFPLSDKRRSGFLPPTFAFSTRSGLDYSQPYYINIAPNRDATVATNISTKRGIDLYGEFRYLEERYRGQIEANFMPRDRLTGGKRWSYRARHDQTFPTRIGTFGLNVELNRVSDNTYWRDFENFVGTRSDLISQRLLPNTATLNWSYGNWSAYVREQRWQTLQLPAPNNIVPPFDLSPQVHARYARNNVKGFDVSVDLDTTRFRSDPLLTGYPNGTRSYAFGRISYPFVRPWGYVTPAVELNATHYQTATPMPNGQRSASHIIPSFSVDSGLVFERDAKLFGRNVLQTLEPRLFYVYTPYRNQQHLPVYDSALKDFNFASIFSSNPFTGYDRVSNNNTLTGGLTSRWYDADSGAELARLSLAQRHRFSPRRVFLNAGDLPEQQSFSNILIDGSIQWNPKWSAEASLVYDQRTNRFAQGRIGMRYQPGPYRVLTANLSRQPDGTEQFDAGWQWPLNALWGDRGKSMPPGQGLGSGQWYSVGRVFYSIKERRVTDMLLGLEYDACCWIARVGWRRQQTQTLPRVVNNSIMVQLEFNGLTRVGTGALSAFRKTIPGYTPLRQPGLYQRSRFERYD